MRVAFVSSILIHLVFGAFVYGWGSLSESWRKMGVAEAGPIEVVFSEGTSPVPSANNPYVAKRPTRLPPKKQIRKATQILSENQAGIDTGDAKLKDMAREELNSVDPSGAARGFGALSPAEAQYLVGVRALLEARKEYPMAARRLGHHGRVVVRFVLARSGRIEKAEILKNSSSEILNRAARDLIMGLHEVKPFPEEVALSEWAVVVPIEYQM